MASVLVSRSYLRYKKSRTMKYHSPPHRTIGYTPVKQMNIARQCHSERISKSAHGPQAVALRFHPTESRSPAKSRFATVTRQIHSAYLPPIRHTTTSSRSITRRNSWRWAHRLATLANCRSIRSSLCLQRIQHPPPSKIPENAITAPDSNCCEINLNSPEYIKTNPPNADPAINPMTSSHKQRDKIRSVISPKIGSHSGVSPLFKEDPA
jgi:hypothetical protein